MAIINSTVVIYKDCKITPDRNFLVENIADYLQLIEIGAQTFNDFQYIEHSLNLTITLNAETATWLNPFSTATRYNYCSIKNDSDSFPIYYFIIDKQWTAQKTITLTLLMDTINSFRVGTDYTLGDKTQVTREHKDRVYFGTVSHGGKTYYRRKIDFLSEGITPVCYKSQESTIYDNDDTNDWYLMYMANNTGETTEQNISYPVNTYLFASNPIPIKTSQSEGFVLDVADIAIDHVYYFGRNVFSSLNGTMVVDDVVYSIGDVCALAKTNNGEELVYSVATGKTDAEGYCTFSPKARFDLVNDTPEISFFMPGQLYGVDKDNTREQVQKGEYADIGGRIIVAHDSVIEPESTGVASSIDALDTVDRTDPKILKIIALPYCPFNLVKDSSGNLVIPSYATVDTITWTDGQTEQIRTYLKLKSNYQGAFQKELMIDEGVFNNLFTEIDLESDVRNDSNESKLYHSDYYYNKFVYDSFSYPIHLENISHDSLLFYLPDEKLKTNMVTTNTINSRFLFDFVNLGNYKTTEDYDHIMMIDRNNEVPIYNSDYINYIRTGYNYDKKNKTYSNIQSAFGIVGGALGVVSGGLGLGNVFGEAAKYNTSLQRYNNYIDRMRNNPEGLTRTEEMIFRRNANPPVRPQLGLQGLYAVGQITSGVQGITSGIISIAQNEANFNQKQEQIKQSSVSVIGADDLDLMKYYSGNKAKMCEYKVSTQMKNKLADLFYYCGYDAGGEQKSPELNTRKWFNYIQCTPEIKSTKNISQEIIDELKDRWAIGVTILHENNSLYDWEQTKANNERWLYN